MVVSSLRAVAWLLGQLLGPQALQQLQAYLETLVRHSFRLLVPFAWGLKSVQINKDALQRFVVEVEQGEIVMPDGMLLRFAGQSPHSNVHIDAGHCEAFLDPGGEALPYALAIRRQQCVEQQAFVHHDVRVEEVETPDFLTPGNRSPVSYLLFQGQIIFAPEYRRYADATILPLGSVRRALDGPGAILCDEDIPPCLTISAWPALRKMLQRLHDHLARLGHDLEAYTLRGPEIVQRLRLVNSYMAQLAHGLDCDLAPYLLYGVMRQLVGEVTAYTEGVSLRDMPLPPYQHERLGACFPLAVQRSIELLNKLMPGPADGICLFYDGQSRYSAPLLEAFLVPDGRYAFAVKRARHLTLADLSDRLKRCKIATPDTLDAKSSFALKGLALSPIHPAQEMSLSEAYFYFSFDQTGLVWREIVDQHHIAIDDIGGVLPASTTIVLVRMPEA